MLEQILSKWENGSYVLLFVSEGTSKQKLKSIQSSYYLNTFYREVLTNLPDNLVIFGWGLGEHDLHILHRMAKSGIQRVAVSVYNNDQAYCTRVKQIISDAFGDNCQLVFFDSESEDCWINNHTPQLNTLISIFFNSHRIWPEPVQM